MPVDPTTEARNTEHREQKLARQKQFLADMIEQLTTDNGKGYKGILPTLKTLDIPLGTFLRWQSDPDFEELQQELSLTNRLAVRDHVWRAILTGVGQATVSSALGVLARIDPEYADRLKVDTTVSNVSVTNAYRPARGKPAQDTDTPN